MLYEIRNLQKSRNRGAGYRLEIRNLSISRGERIVITGPSGCGKSTLLDMLGLALRPDCAEIFNFSPCGDKSSPIKIMEVWQNGSQDSLAALRLSYMGYVLQSGELLPFVSVRENMELTGRLAGQPVLEVTRAVDELAGKLGVAHLFNARPATLSFGERQRTAIVRALATRPHVILADEPTASLDPFHAQKVMEAFLAAIAAYGATLVLVTHNLTWAKAFGAREIGFTMLPGKDGMTAIIDDSRQH